MPKKIISHHLSARPKDADIIHGDADLLFFKIEWHGYGMKPTLQNALEFAADARCMAKKYLRDEIRKDKTAAQKAHRLHKACEAAYKVIDSDKKLGRKKMKNLFVDGDLDQE